MCVATHDSVGVKGALWSNARRRKSKIGQCTNHGDAAVLCNKTQLRVNNKHTQNFEPGREQNEALQPCESKKMSEKGRCARCAEKPHKNTATEGKVVLAEVCVGKRQPTSEAITREHLPAQQRRDTWAEYFFVQLEHGGKIQQMIRERRNAPARSMSERQRKQ